MKTGRRNKLLRGIVTLALLLLLASCGTVRVAPSTPDPESCLRSLPALDDPTPIVTEKGQALDFIETMRSFLSGILVLQPQPSPSATPVMPSTEPPTPSSGN